MYDHAPNYLDILTPFGLPKPDPGWLRILFEWDPELVVFPSMTQPVYRLMRRAIHSGPVTYAALKHILTDAKGAHPDTKLAIEHHLVAVTTLPPGTIALSAVHLVEHLKARDLWQYTKGDPGSDAGADRLDELDKLEREATSKAFKDDLKDRRKAARISYGYRTGARLSLVSPRRFVADDSAKGIPAEAVSQEE